MVVIKLLIRELKGRKRILGYLVSVGSSYYFRVGGFKGKGLELLIFIIGGFLWFSFFWGWGRVDEVGFFSVRKL